MDWISGLWTQVFEWKLCLEGLISDLRTFLSAKKLPWSCYEAQEE
jgi:hypothetical protein